jgi:RNA polymerase sigma factor (sigma-70 family)
MLAFVLADVIQAAQKGDENAMITLLNQFEPLINKYTRMVALESEDARQELSLAFIQLVLNIKLSSFNIICNGTLVSYISKSMYHAYIVISKKQAKSFDKASLCEHMHYNDLAYSTFDQYNNLFIGEIEETLTKKEFFVICCHYFHGMTIDEIAKKIGISRQGVNKTKNRALEKLKESYKLHVVS